MNNDTKIVTNPVEIIWSGCKGNYGVVWQVISLLLGIAALSIFANLWNGLQGRSCAPETAAIDLKNADRTARLVGCGSRSFLEMIAGEDGSPAIESTEPTAPAPPDVIQVPE
jgi:hypothetical protein